MIQINISNQLYLSRVKVLAISGSLRRESSNSRMVRAMAQINKVGVKVIVYDELDQLPHFNPDLDLDPAPAKVSKLRQVLAEADAVVISSPEYAHGVPGSLKNAIDWVVSSGELMAKPVALLNLAPRAYHAQESLAEILRTADAIVLPQASPALFVPRRDMSESDFLADTAIAAVLSDILDVLANFLAEAK